MKPSLLSFALLLQLTVAPLFAADEDIQQIIQKGDALEAKIATQAALEVYLTGEKIAPNNADLLWRIARQNGELMVDATSKEQKRALAEKALDYANRSVAADPQSTLAQTSLAVCYARIAPLLDNKTKIAYSKLVKEHAEKARAIDPNNDLAWHVLGAWNYELATLNPVLKGIARMIYGALPAASLEVAAENFRQAVKLNPQRLANHVELGRTLAEMGQKDEAKKSLERGLAMPNREKDDPGTKQRASDTLKKL